MDLIDLLHKCIFLSLLACHIWFLNTFFYVNPIGITCNKNVHFITVNYVSKKDKS